MNVQRFLALICALLFALTALNVNPAAPGTNNTVRAEVVEAFKGGEDTKVLTFTGPGIDNSTAAFSLETGVTFESAHFTVEGMANANGTYPEDIEIDVGNDGDVDWAFDGHGYGALGRQESFNTSTPILRLEFLGQGGASRNAGIRLPFGAQVTSATMKVGGEAEGERELFLIGQTNIGGLYYARHTAGTTFAGPSSLGDITTSSGHTGAAVADFDGDGDFDFVTVAAVSGVSEKTMYYYENTGTGPIFTQSTLPFTLLANSHPMDMAAADFDQDGNMDFMANGYDQTTGYVFLGAGDGTFTKNSVGFGVQTNYGKASEDFNEDGFPDIVMGGNTVTAVFLNDGTGTGFTKSTFTPATNYGCTAGDFDNDGHADILWSTSNAMWYFVPGNGDGTFGTGVYSGLDSGSSYGGYGDTFDFNGDGNIDLLGYGDYSNAIMYIWPGNGDGTFSLGTSIGDIGSSAMCIAAPDGYGWGPDDMELKLGSSTLWSKNGALETTVQVPDFTSEINSYLGQFSGPSGTDEYGNEYADIPLTFTTSSSGYAEVSELEVVYQYEAVAGLSKKHNLAEELNELMEGKTGGNKTIPIAVKVGTEGRLVLGGLNISYNAPPRLIPIPPQRIPEDSGNGMVLDLEDYFSDDGYNGTGVDYSIKLNSHEMRFPGTVINGSELWLDMTGEPDWNSEGTDLIELEVEAKDGFGLKTRSETFTVEVMPFNDEPRPSVDIGSIYLMEGNEDKSVFLASKPYFIDPENDLIFYEAAVDPLDTVEVENLTAEIDLTGRLTITAMGDFFTAKDEVIPVWVFADDDSQVNTTANGDGNYVYLEVPVMVGNVNDDPVFAPMPTIYTDEDAPVEDALNVFDYISDVDSELDDMEVSLVTRSLAGGSVKLSLSNDGWLSIAPQDDYSGKGTVRIEVDDGDDGEAEGEVKVVVVPMNDRPTLTVYSPVNHSTAEGLVQVMGAAGDAEDNLISVQVQMAPAPATGSPPTAYLIADSAIPWMTANGLETWTYEWDTEEVVNGEYIIRCRAFDGVNHSGIEYVMVTVNNPVPQIPTVVVDNPLVIAGSTAQVSGKVTISGRAMDLDSAIVAVYVKIDEGPWELAMGTDTWTYEWNTKNVEDGPHTIGVYASDGVLNSAEIVLNVEVSNNAGDGSGGSGDGNDSKSGNAGDEMILIAIVIVIIVVVAIIALFFIMQNQKEKKRKEEKERKRKEEEKKQKELADKLAEQLAASPPLTMATSPGMTGAAPGQTYAPAGAAPGTGYDPAGGAAGMGYGAMGGAAAPGTDPAVGAVGMGYDPAVGAATPGYDPTGAAQYGVQDPTQQYQQAYGQPGAVAMAGQQIAGALPPGQPDAAVTPGQPVGGPQYGAPAQAPAPMYGTPGMASPDPMYVPPAQAYPPAGGPVIDATAISVQQTPGQVYDVTAPAVPIDVGTQVAQPMGGPPTAAPPPAPPPPPSAANLLPPQTLGTLPPQ